MRTPSTTTQAQEFGRALGRSIAAQRKARGLTQDDLAGLVEVDTESISRIERGTVMPSLARLVQITSTLNVGMTELLGQASTAPSDEEQQLLHTVRNLPTDDRQLLLDFAQLLAQRR